MLSAIQLRSKQTLRPPLLGRSLQVHLDSPTPHCFGHSEEGCFDVNKCSHTNLHRSYVLTLEQAAYDSMEQPPEALPKEALEAELDWDMYCTCTA